MQERKDCYSAEHGYARADVCIIKHTLTGGEWACHDGSLAAALAKLNA